ncbi:hypothetical protein BDA99DRAFT_116578 [Phascolomyces articulosus]|uniref:Secreted protein n=1 Tax=Phascolomyces articulosus TaxID=60185 RepID=A0AAD5KMV6_9FUNG|nr:hypothetical protein BDA99DRAFT_116578 [Phascolomyces articulosus]
MLLFLTFAFFIGAVEDKMKKRFQVLIFQDGLGRRGRLLVVIVTDSICKIIKQEQEKSVFLCSMMLCSDKCDESERYIYDDS